MALLSAILILMAGSGIGAAADEPAQAAGNNSTLNQYNLASTVQSSSPTITETRITTNPSNSWEPSIYGNKIVWTDDRNGNNDIYIQDLSTKKQIHTTNTAAQHSPDIYENRVVWEDERNGGHDIYLQDLSTSKQTRITTSGKACSPKIYANRIVWMDGRNGGSLDESNWPDGNWDIYMYDLSTSTEYQITTNESIQQDPDIYGDRIVWGQDNRNKDEYYRCDIYMYDLSANKETHISKYSYQNYNPGIYGDRIVWTAEDEASNYNIGMFDISTSTETLIATGYYGTSGGPAIYKDRIVWTDGRDSWGNGNSDIYMYNLSTSTEIQITTNESGQGGPDIYENRIVWQDDRNGNQNDVINYDIYMGTLSESEPTPEPPVANFSATSLSGKAPLKVKFTSTSTGSPTEWKWNFGDGSDLVTEQNPEHTYSTAGVYTVKHTAINAYGRDTEIKTNYITVESAAPNADFSASPTSGNALLTVKFTDKSTGSPTAWKWSFGDGSALVTEYNPIHIYSKPGTYTVKETVSNAAGKDTEIKTNYITVKAAPIKPVAAFSASPTSGKAPLKVQFTDKSTNSPTSWKWSFGDGTYSTSKSPSHRYSKTGKYTVYLTATNKAGSNTKTMSGYITVKK
ncbi:PKD domain-containing protein [Methanosarcina sp. Z-7115]|uniref:PKD domain-containing protein n=1 Tax=Methanosarcina baikalica TaxID=3073890 RepID=A0ABU2CZU7_9EURY|nr:PKD domain-containing protein [Methanosarcina sp. Z-7115]MDR7665260.1 PKD domain-containing protein [Methanosarcina sp. Z-7115]